MAFCCYCGNPIQSEARFCSSCGAKVIIPTTTQQTFSTPHKFDNGPRIVGVKNPLFRVRCVKCNRVIEYRTKHLQFKRFYPSGYISCPFCKETLRHKLEYEVKDI